MSATDIEPRPAVVGLGEALWDCFGPSRRPGGAPANVAFHAGQFGFRGVLCSRVGQDADGEDLLRILAERGVDTCCVQQDPQHPTGRVTVEATASDDPRYVIHPDAAWDYMEDSDAWREQLRSASAVCFGTLAQRSPVSRRTIARCLDGVSDGLLVYDVNLRPPWFDLRWVEASLQRSQVVKLNEREILTVGAWLDKGLDSPARVAEALLNGYDLHVVCVTRGAHGCLIRSRSEVVDTPGSPVDVVDPVGAGDAFTAALIVGLLRGWPLASIASLADQTGAMVAGRAGAMPVLREELAALLHRCAPAS